MSRLSYYCIVITLIGICTLSNQTRCSAAMIKVDAHERLLVFAPHPDDEVLGCGGLIQRVKALGGTVGVIYLTAGDGCVSFNPMGLVNGKRVHRGLGYRRMREAISAMSRFGISRDCLVFLGYPDRGLLPLWNMQTNPYREYRSKMTGADYVFYPDSESQGLSYDYESLIQSLGLVIERCNPTMVLIPARWDRHQDHRATNYLVKMVLKSKKRTPKILSYLVHYQSWPDKVKWEGFDEVVHLPKDLPSFSYELWLVPTEYRNKIEAINTYRSQYPAMNNNMRAFARGEEVFWRESLQEI